MREWKENEWKEKGLGVCVCVGKKTSGVGGGGGGGGGKTFLIRKKTLRVLS